MKRLALSIIAVLTLCGRMAAQQVTVSDVEAVPGETLSFTIQLDTKGGSYVGLEFDVQFSQDGFVTTGNATTIADWNGSFTIGEVGAVGINNLARCGILSYSSTPIPGEGLMNLGQVEIKVDNTVSLGDYVVTLTNVTLVGDERVPVADATFNVSVVDAHNVLLDENATTPPTNVSPANVRVRRTINADEWSTICLPFDMTEAQVKEAFGNDVQLGDFVGADSEFDDADNVTGITVNFNDASAIEANHPYIIKVSEPVEEFTIDGVDIVADEDEAYIEFDNGKSGSRRVVYSGFYGTYHAGTVLDEFTLFLSSNKFYYSDGSIKMKGYRAYFEFLDVLTEIEGGPHVKIFFGGDDDETGIDRVITGRRTEDDVYDLSGRRVGRQPQRGIYIVNGKKVVIK